MKKIKENEKIYTIISKFPEVRDVLVSLGMTPIADDRNLNTVGRIVSLKQALKQVSVDNGHAQEVFNEIGIEVDFNE